MIKKAKDFSNELVKTFNSLDEDSLYCRKFIPIGKAPRKNIDKKPDDSFGTYSNDEGYFHKQYVTTLEIDRDNEVVLQSGIDWKEYQENNIVLNMHNYRELPIGQCVKLEKDEYGWAGTTKYYVNDEKDSVGYKNWEYRSKGFPMGISIGFAIKEYALNKKYGDEFAKGWDIAYNQWKSEYKLIYKKNPKEEPDVIFTKVIAYEYSDVTVPSNPGAVGGKDALDIVLISKDISTDGLIDVSKIKEVKQEMKEDQKVENKEQENKLEKRLSVLEESISEIKNLLTQKPDNGNIDLIDEKNKETEENKNKENIEEYTLDEVKEALIERNNKLVKKI
jgi:hypothetical protein